MRMMYAYPDQVAGHGRGPFADYIGKTFAAFPEMKVNLLARTDPGMRQIAPEQFDLHDGSPTCDAALVYSISRAGISRLDFVREL